MNYTTAVFLINDKCRAVLATYEAGDKAQKTMFKTLDQGLRVDDFVLVPTNTRHNLTVVKVTDVDVEFDIETTTPIEWVVGRVELADYKNLLFQEQAAITAIQSAEKNRKREELRKTLLADVEKTVSGMAIAAIGHDPIPQPPPPHPGSGLDDDQPI